VRDPTDDRDARPPFDRTPQRAVADKRQRPTVDASEGVGEPNDVLTFGQRPDMHERRRLELGGRRRVVEAHEVDPRIDHLGLAARVR
jgi:hypothetical protein